MSKTILAIDIGFRNMGCVVFRNGAVIMLTCIGTKAENKNKTAVRVADQDAEACAWLARGITAIIKEYGIGGVVAEMPTNGTKSQRAAACMAMGKAVVATVLELHQLPHEWTTPEAGKVAAGKSKGASKATVGEKVSERWPDLVEAGEHCLDAAAAYMAAENGTLVRLLNAQ